MLSVVKDGIQSKITLHIYAIMARDIKIYVAMWLQTLTKHTSLAPNELCPVTAYWPCSPGPWSMCREVSCTTGHCPGSFLPWVTDQTTSTCRIQAGELSPLTTCYRALLLLLSSLHFTLTHPTILSGGFCKYSQ